MRRTKEDLNNPLLKVKEEIAKGMGVCGCKKPKMSKANASPIQIGREVEVTADFTFLDSKICRVIT